MHTNLREYLHTLRKEGDLLEISGEVDPYLEAAEIHRRTIAAGGPALLFKNIKGASFPLVTNLFGTKKRIELAFGDKPKQLLSSIAGLPHKFFPPTMSKLWEERDLLTSLLKIGTKTTSRGPVREVEQIPPKLSHLPLLTTWKEDGGPFVTLPLVLTEHPTTKVSNLGMYRLQRYDDQTTGFHCQIGKGAGFHLAEAERLKQNLPVNVFLGGPPALLLSAVAPLPENVPELLLASLVQQKKLSTTHNPLGPLPLVSEAEFAIVGEVYPHERRTEGPFGDHYGYYSLAHDFPVLHVKGIYRRKDALCTATVVGKPCQEDFFLGDYLQDLLSPLFPVVMPSVKSLWSYGETGYHSLTAAVVRTRYKREALVSAFRILGESQLSLTKFLLLTDGDVEVRNFKTLLTHILQRVNFSTDLYLLSNTAMDTLDYNGPALNQGSKGVLMGCGNAIRDLPRIFAGSLPPEITAAIPYCPGCLVIQGEGIGAGRSALEQVIGLEIFKEWPMVVAVDNAQKATKDDTAFLWTTFTRFDPAAHIVSKKRELLGNHLSHTGPILIDARLKPGFPDELECDPATKALVDKRWPYQ